MQHPFEGVMGGKERTETRPTRRSMLGGILGAVAALFGVGTAAAAQTMSRRPTTLALGEEGSGRPPQGRGPTTLALGEESGQRQRRGGTPTTLAFGEESGNRLPPSSLPPLPPVPDVPPVPPVPPLPTLAYGEEGGVTTYALGEEGGRY
jgi:hypothetical protein